MKVRQMWGREREWGRNGNKDGNEDEIKKGGGEAN